jgi:hypothetical protein
MAPMPHASCVDRIYIGYTEHTPTGGWSSASHAHTIPTQIAEVCMSQDVMKYPEHDCDNRFKYICRIWQNR